MKKISLSIIAVLVSAISFSQILQFEQILNWSGTGSNQAMLIIDFNDSTANECYAFGYKFDGQKTAEDMLIAISNQNPDLDVSIFSGFLSDITYFNQAGIGGNPYYWGTFTEVNNQWQTNLGITELISNNLVFGCSYTDWDSSTWEPLNVPENPIPAPAVTNIQKFQNFSAQIFPNPSSDFLNISSEFNIDLIEIFSLNGNKVFSKSLTSNQTTINISDFSNGNYLIVIKSNNNSYSKFITKK